jgi:ribosome biogenesis GTPase
MNLNDITLASLGWTDHFARQTEGADPALRPARLTGIERSRVTALTPDGALALIPHQAAGSLAVGDFVLQDGVAVRQRLTPLTELARVAPGGGRQLIAANVQTLAIVTSCNADFNPARLERYLALALASGCLPLIVLTKADMTQDPGAYARKAGRLSPLVTAVTLDARDPDQAAALAPWAGPGQTLALVGMSGVGKTTLQNALTGAAALTAEIREDDARGRHTTTSRALRPTLAGGWLIDTPGMRELGLAEAADGLAQAFAEITDLAGRCRFRDCQHDGEPGCAVTAAIAAGELDEGRLRRFQKLRREDDRATESWHERHERARGWARATSAGRERSRFKRRGPGD